MSDKLEGIRAIGFDLDGTLYSSAESDERIRDQVALRIFEKRRDLSSLAEARRFFDERYAEIESATLVLESVGYERPSEVMDRCLAEADVLDLISPNNELANTMRAISSSHDSVYLLTDSPRELGLAKLERIGIPQNVFQTMVFSDTNGAGPKPSGEAFRYVVDLLGIPPENHLYVGDRRSSDILPAKKLGMKTLIVGKRVEEADFFIEKINDLGGLLL